MTQIKLNPVEFPASHVWKHYRKAVNDKILTDILKHGYNPVSLEIYEWNKVFLPWIDQDNFNYPTQSKARITQLQNRKIYLPDGGPWFAGMLDCVIDVTSQEEIFSSDSYMKKEIKKLIKHLNLTIFHSPECTIGVLTPWGIGENVFCLEKKTEKGFETMLVRLKMGGWI